MGTLRTTLVTGYAGMLALSAAAVAAVLLGHRWAAAGLVGGEQVFAGWLVWRVGRATIDPLKVLAEDARDVGDGRRDAVSTPRAAAEVTTVADAINSLAAAQRQTHSDEQGRTQRARLAAQAVIDSFPHATALVSLAGVVELANAPAAGFGLRAGLPATDALQPWLGPLLAAARTGRVDHRPPIQRFEGGDERFFLPQAAPVLGPGGEAVAVTLLLLDVTDELEAREAQSGLLSSLSHKLKSPLTSIQMSVHLLLEDTVDRLTPRQAELLQAAREDADRLQRAVETALAAKRDEQA